VPLQFAAVQESGKVILANRAYIRRQLDNSQDRFPNSLKSKRRTPWMSRIYTNLGGHFLVASQLGTQVWGKNQEQKKDDGSQSAHY
jgi:hypothetical protein